jgi:DNA-binding MarR family transcriptional regulator
MMVSNGNLTGLVDRLVRSGHLARRRADADRRAQVVSITEAGRAEFRAMAAEHEGWIDALFRDLAAEEVDDLMRLLSKLKRSARRAVGSEEGR